MQHPLQWSLAAHFVFFMGRLPPWCPTSPYFASSVPIAGRFAGLRYRYFRCSPSPEALPKPVPPASTGARLRSMISSSSFSRQARVEQLGAGPGGARGAGVAGAVGCIAGGSGFASV